MLVDGDVLTLPYRRRGLGVCAALRLADVNELRVLAICRSM
jgi:hypothetical protein